MKSVILLKITSGRAVDVNWISSETSAKNEVGQVALS